jgi:hypothetical protein
MKNQLLALAAATLMPFAASSAQVEAMPAPISGPSNVLSLQPLNAIFTMYSGEYERRTSRSLSFGVGATHWDVGDDSDNLTYTSGDLKLRFYPQGAALHGFSFGGSVGFSSISATSSFDGTTEESVSGPSFGILIEHQWLMGASRNFAVALGVGAKAVMVDEDEISSDDFIARYPTIRISVGYAF